MYTKKIFLNKSCFDKIGVEFKLENKRSFCIALEHALENWVCVCSFCFIWYIIRLVSHPFKEGSLLFGIWNSEMKRKGVVSDRYGACRILYKWMHGVPEGEMKATEYLKKDGSPEVDYKITQLFLESEDWVWRQGVGNEIHAPGSESRL